MQKGDRADPVHLRHREIQDDHVGAELLGEPDRFFAITRLTDNLEPPIGLQDHAEDPPEVGYIVYNKNPDGHIASSLKEAALSSMGDSHPPIKSDAGYT